MKRLKKNVFILSALTAIIVLTALSVRAQRSLIDEIQGLERSVVEVKSMNSEWFKSPQGRPVIDPSTGRIIIMRKAAQAAYQRTGTGIVIHPSGIIVTNAHNVFKADIITVTLADGGEYPVQVLRVVNDLDLALLKITVTQPLRPVPLADSDQLKLGTEIISLGNSHFIKGTISSGKITGLGTSLNAGQGVQLIRTSINIYQGDSGGPLLDREGRLVGLMTAKETGADHSSFAIPANRIAGYLNEYLTTSPVKK